jgi:hypothetical protein
MSAPSPYLLPFGPLLNTFQLKRKIPDINYIRKRFHKGLKIEIRLQKCPRPKAEASLYFMRDSPQLLHAFSGS